MSGFSFKTVALAVCGPLVSQIVLCEPRHLEAADRLQEIVAQVQKNEALYQNLEIVLDEKYDSTIGNPPPPLPGRNVRQTLTQELRTRCVVQGELFFVERKGRFASFWDESVDDQTWSFDGKVTRCYNRPRQQGEIYDGRWDCGLLVRPYMLMLRGMVVDVPLATYLQGDQAVAAYPGARLPERIRTEISYQGQTEFRGLKCHKVWITSVFKASGTPHGRWELWLAEAKNYIPVRERAWTFRWSKDIPIAEAEIDGWQELKPGVWFPGAMQLLRYDSSELLRTGTQKPSWRRDYKVVKVTLDPKVDVALFRDLEYPDGTLIAEMKEGKVVRSYVKGARPPKDAPPNPGAPRP